MLIHAGIANLRMYVLACSRAGTIAIDFTLEHPTRVDALVTVDAALSGFQPVQPPEIQALFKGMDALRLATSWRPRSPVHGSM